jgi:hypothetical protein
LTVFDDQIGGLADGADAKRKNARAIDFERLIWVAACVHQRAAQGERGCMSGTADIVCFTSALG